MRASTWKPCDGHPTPKDEGRLPRTHAVRRDIVQHVFQTSGDAGAAARREREITDLIASIAENPHSGTRLRGKLDGWLVRHGGRRRLLTVVFRAHDEDTLLIALVAFGGKDWQGAMERRRDFGR